MADASGGTGTISVFLADDNLIVREGVRALIERHKDLRIVGVAADYDEVVRGGDLAPAPGPGHRHPDAPAFNREGIDAAKEVRKRHPGTGVVILSQYDDPEYAVSLLAEGSAGYGYLLKDHIAQGDQLVDAIRAVATGGNALDPAIVDALVRPVTSNGGLSPAEEELLGMVAEGKPIKAIAAAKAPPARGGRRRGRGGVRQAGRGGVGRHGGRAPAAAPAAQGDRRPRGAGGDALAPPSRGAGGEAPARRAPHRRDRAGRRARCS